MKFDNWNLIVCVNFKRWAFVDYENQPQLINFIKNITDYSCLFIFFGAQQKVSMELNTTLSIRLIKIENSGKNNLDFHLTYYLGKYDIKLDKRIGFDIFTNDTGFDHLIKFIQQQGRNCQRIALTPSQTSKQIQSTVSKTPSTHGETIEVITNPNVILATQRVVDNLKKVAHRPTSVDKLMNVINSLIRPLGDNTLTTKQVLDELQKQNKINLNLVNKTIHWHF